MGKYNIEKKKWNQKYSEVSLVQEYLKGSSKYEDVFSNRSTLKPVYHFFDLQDRNATILDFGCGSGWATTLIAQKVNNVCAFDISHASLKVLRSVLEHNSLSNVCSCVANAEKLPFRDEYFDYVFGHSIFHHLDLNPALAETNRVLKKGGKAAFCEPFGHNPIINLYRYIKHNYLEEFKGTDMPFNYTDKIVFENYFRKVEFIEVSFLSDKVPALRPFEATILKRFPFTRKFASCITILLQK